LADRIAIVDHGRLIACGPLAALRAQAAVDGSLEEVFLTLTREEEGGPAAPLSADRDGIALPGSNRVHPS
jgi:ABC-2 type transport system ATP-binding protein